MPILAVPSFASSKRADVALNLDSTLNNRIGEITGEAGYSSRVQSWAIGAFATHAL